VDLLYQKILGEFLGNTRLLHFPFEKKESLVFAEGYTEIGLFRFSRTIYFTSHYCHIYGLIDVGNIPFKLLDDFLEINFTTPARGTGDNVYTFFSKTHAAQYVVTGYHLVRWVGCQGNP